MKRETIEQRAKRILDILIEARDIHPLFVVSIETLAERFFYTEYTKAKKEETPHYYTEKFHKRIKRTIPKVMELAEMEGLTVFWIRKPNKRDSLRFSRILGYRILLPDEIASAYLVEQMYLTQRILDNHNAVKEFREMIIQNLYDGDENRYNNAIKKIDPDYDWTLKEEDNRNEECILEQLKKEYQMSTYKVQIL